jgi:hypothetical protein
MTKTPLIAAVATLLLLGACTDDQTNTSAPTSAASDPSIQDGPSNNPDDVLE